MKLLPLGSFIVALSIAQPSFAQSDGLKQPQNPQQFVTTAAQDGMAEVELGRLASTRAQSPEVRDFAGRMVRDHGKANEDLAAIAKAKGLTVPGKLDEEHRSMVDMLKAKSGAEFDNSYMQHMADAHEKAVSLFQGALGMKDAELATFAKRTLPTLEEHKRIADSLAASVKGRTAPVVN